MIIYFEDIENIENLLLLLTDKNNNKSDFSNIVNNLFEDINQHNLNKAYINLYKQRSKYIYFTFKFKYSSSNKCFKSIKF